MSRSFLIAFLLAGIILAKEIVPPNVIPGEVLMKLAPGTTLIRGKTTATGIAAVDAVLANYRVRSVEPMFRTQRQRRRDLPDISRIYRVTYDADVSPRSVARRLETLPQVLYAEPNFIHRISEIPDDPQYANQWHLAKIQTGSGVGRQPRRLHRPDRYCGHWYGHGPSRS